jgi:hypothetical protein
VALSVAHTVYRRLIGLVSNELETVWKEVVVTKFVVLSRCFPGGTDETIENFSFGLAGHQTGVCIPVFRVRSSVARFPAAWFSSCECVYRAGIHLAFS